MTVVAAGPVPPDQDPRHTCPPRLLGPAHLPLPRLRKCSRRWYTRFEPIFLQTKRHTAWYEAEAAVLGLTALQQYEVDSFSGVNLGERSAFTAAGEPVAAGL